MDELASVSTWLWVVLGLALVLQISLMIWALVDVIKRADARIRGPKWLWIVIILLGELIGSIVYLVFARLPETVDVAPQRTAGDRVTDAADVLYGPAPTAAPEQPAERRETDATSGS